MVKVLKLYLSNDELPDNKISLVETVEGNYAKMSERYSKLVGWRAHMCTFCLDLLSNSAA